LICGDFLGDDFTLGWSDFFWNLSGGFGKLLWGLTSLSTMIFDAIFQTPRTQGVFKMVSKRFHPNLQDYELF
jgi:hypothetical protein